MTHESGNVSSGIHRGAPRSYTKQVLGTSKSSVRGKKKKESSRKKR